MDWAVPTLADVLDARGRISAYLRPTPLYRYPAIDQRLAAEVYLKHENHQPVGAFKVRGGINLISRLDADERSRGVISASTGNHGQSVAYAARLFGVPATICVPEKANPVKVASMRGLGAEVMFYGRNFDEARLHAERLAREGGRRFVHTANEPLLIAGVGTATLEILEDQPRIEVIIVPVGGGHGAAASCIVAKAINPEIKVIAVQSREAPAAFRSWRERRLVEDKVETFAEGLATGTAFEFTQRILWDLLDDFVLVSDDEIAAAVRACWTDTHNLAEGAGAAALAAAMKERSRLRGRKVGLVLSGGNIDFDLFTRWVVAAPIGAAA